MTDKKELKKKYKQQVAEMGIFQIRNLQNGKILVVRGRGLQAVINRCRYQLKYGLFYSTPELQEDYSRLGEENFSFEILDRLEAKTDPGYDPSPDLALLEELWLEKLQPYGEKGYHKK